jgi:hypothetical protein
MNEVIFKNKYDTFRSGSGSSVGIVTGYGLDGPGIESQHCKPEGRGFDTDGVISLA